MTAPQDPSPAGSESETLAPLEAVRRATESVLGAGAAATTSTGSADSTATIERPGEPADPESGDDEVVDGEITDGEITDDDRAGGGEADDVDTVDAELVDEPASAVSEDVPAGASPDPVAAPDAAPGAPVGTDDTLVGAGATQPTAGSVVPGTSAPVVSPPAPAFDYTDQGVPTLDYLRDKIEGRWGTAMGSTELAEASQAGRQQGDAAEERDRLAREKLAEIRRQVGGGNGDADPAG